MQTASESTILLVFAAASAVMGTVVVLLDWIILTVHGRSLLNLGYAGVFRSLGMVALWGAGAGLGALLGGWADIFEINRNACLVAGVAWPAVLPRVLAATGESEEIQQPAGDS